MAYSSEACKSSGHAGGGGYVPRPAPEPAIGGEGNDNPLPRAAVPQAPARAPDQDGTGRRTSPAQYQNDVAYRAAFDAGKDRYTPNMNVQRNAVLIAA